MSDTDTKLDTNINQVAEELEVKEFQDGLGVKPETPHEDDEDEERGSAKRDSELEDAASEEDREAIRARRRTERKTRNERRRDKMETLERKIESLLTQNKNLSAQVSTIVDANAGAQIAQIDKAIAEAQNAAVHYKSVIADASTRGEGGLVAEATEAMIVARNRADELAEYKRQASRPATQTKPLDPEMQRLSRKFIEANSWYGGPRSNDPDSKVLTALDNSLAAENWDPTTEHYWVELEARKAKYLPHRVSRENTPKPANGGYNGRESASGSLNPVGGGSSEGTNQGGAVNVGLSAERVKAIKEAGAWDDPKRRNALISSYKAYDSANKR